MIKILKKFSALLVTAGILVGSTCVVQAKFIDNFEDFALLKGLGIVAEETDYEMPATRADLARVGLGLTNRLGQYDGQLAATVYTDVTDEEVASDIYGAYATGIMVGDGSGYFKPDEIISKEMVTAVMGRVCGYGALDRELWASFGINDLELYKRVSLSSPITLGELYKVAQNCLDAQMLSVKPSKDAYGNYVKAYEKSGESVLEYYFDVYEGSGIVSANSVSGLISAAMNSRVNTVVINDIVYDVGNTDAYELFGLNCDFYYMERDNDDPVLVCITMSKKAEMITIDSGDILSYENNRYTYNDNGRAKTLKSPISETADIIYNGKTLESPDDTSFNAPDWYGEVTLIDNFGAGSYDVVFIYSYKNYVVGTLDARNNVIYDTAHDTSIKLGYSEGEDFDVYINGEKGKLSDIAVDSVASVFEAKDGYKLVYASKNVLSGKIESVSEEDREITADSIVYSVWDTKALSEAKNHYGDTVKLYLDGAMRIAYIDFTNKSADEKYAILLLVKLAEDEDMLRVKLFTQDGEVITCYTGDKFKLNGDTVKLKNGAAGWEDLWKDGVSDNRKLIKYSLSADGILKEVETAVDTAYNDVYNGSVYTGFRRVHKVNTSSNQVRYKTAGTHLVNMDMSVNPVPTSFETSAATLVFVMPDGADSDTSYYAIGSMSQFGNDELVPADIYRSSDSKAVDAIVYKGTESRQAGVYNIIVLDKVKDILNADDEVVVAMTGTINGKANQTLTIKANDSYTYSDGKTLEEFAKSLNRGDFLLYQDNTKGEITYLERKYDAKTKTAVMPDTIYINTGRIVYGNIKGYKDGIVTVVEDANNVEQSYKYSGSVIVHDTTEEIQRVGTNEELIYGKKLALYLYESRAYSAIIYE